MAMERDGKTSLSYMLAQVGEPGDQRTGTTAAVPDSFSSNASDAEFGIDLKRGVARVIASAWLTDASSTEAGSEIMTTDDEFWSRQGSALSTSSNESQQFGTTLAPPPGIGNFSAPKINNNDPIEKPKNGAGKEVPAKLQEVVELLSRLIQDGYSMEELLAGGTVGAPVVHSLLDQQQLEQQQQQLQEMHLDRLRAFMAQQQEQDRLLRQQELLRQRQEHDRKMQELKMQLEAQRYWQILRDLQLKEEEDRLRQAQRFGGMSLQEVQDLVAMLQSPQSSLPLPQEQKDQSLPLLQALLLRQVQQQQSQEAQQAQEPPQQPPAPLFVAGKKHRTPQQNEANVLTKEYGDMQESESDKFFKAVPQAPSSKDAEQQGPKNEEFQDKFRRQFNKTQLCRFHRRGQCRKGESCQFAHGLTDVRAVPDLTKTAICQQWARNCCPLPASQCRFAHGAADRRVTEAFKAVAMCSAHLRGSCTKGSACAFAHTAVTP
mmetsp:Transcript_52005/g.96261  ORF Transcript_52005/g.96261 Transcript_52005/m.96261 type:complete len:488 (+) Transcript_52005:182-1645(+)